ncbi:MAG: hypothetical protein AB9897_03960 [Anaerolineaceae bacterium]
MSSCPSAKYDSDLDYLLVTNLLTRKIRDTWEDRPTTLSRSTKSPEPRPLVIAVEEAHKLLNREMASADHLQHHRA